MIHKSFHLLSNNTLRRLTSYASVVVAGTLILAKTVAYILTDSVALLSSLVDSGVDLLASLITAYGVIIAMRPPDHDHRYGHGKAEALAALTQAAFILVSSALLIKEATHRFIAPAPIQDVVAGYVVMGIAIALTALLLALQSYTVQRTKSLAIASDRLHYVGDILINLAVIVTFACQDFFNAPWIDPLFALVIAGGMCVGAIKIGRGALNVLMDRELPDADRTRILALAKGVQGVYGAHDLRTRKDVDRSIIEIHIEMDPHISLQESHDIAEQVTAAIVAIFPKADITIHQDPFGIKETRLDTQIAEQKPD